MDGRLSVIHRHIPSKAPLPSPRARAGDRNRMNSMGKGVRCSFFPVGVWSQFKGLIVT